VCIYSLGKVNKHLHYETELKDVNPITLAYSNQMCSRVEAHRSALLKLVQKNSLQKISDVILRKKCLGLKF